MGAMPFSVSLLVHDVSPRINGAIGTIHFWSFPMGGMPVGIKSAQSSCSDEPECQKRCRQRFLYARAKFSRYRTIRSSEQFQGRPRQRHAKPHETLQRHVVMRKAIQSRMDRATCSGPWRSERHASTGQSQAMNRFKTLRVICCVK
jgi:hypothetical protein